MQLTPLLYRANDAVYRDTADIQLVKDLRAALVSLVTENTQLRNQTGNR